SVTSGHGEPSSRTCGDSSAPRPGRGQIPHRCATMADVARLLRTRWIAAAVVALLLVGGGLAFAATRSASSIDLPRTTPQRLIAAVLRAGGRAPSVSGTVATRSEEHTSE